MFGPDLVERYLEFHRQQWIFSHLRGNGTPSIAVLQLPFAVSPLAATAAARRDRMRSFPPNSRPPCERLTIVSLCLCPIYLSSTCTTIPTTPCSTVRAKSTS